MVTIETYARQWRGAAKKLVVDHRVRVLAGLAAHFFAGMLVSAASLARHCQPLAMGLLCAFTGWKAAALAAGAGAADLAATQPAQKESTTAAAIAKMVLFLNMINFLFMLLRVLN